MHEKLLKGYSKKTSGIVYGILTKDIDSSPKSNKLLYVTNLSKKIPNGFLGYIVFSSQETSNMQKIFDKNDSIYISEPLQFENGQLLIKIDYSNSVIYQVYDLSKGHIDLYLTGKCHQDCIACPQHRDARKYMFPYNEALLISNVLIGQKSHINISGGEPTFNKNYFIEVLKTLQNNSPKSTLQILTNALSFSKQTFIEKMVSNGIIFEKLLFSIAIYGSNLTIQDKSTNVKGSFFLLKQAINNIAISGGKVELRIVINKINYKDLVNISNLIIDEYKNKITRVVFMGIEMSGVANEHSKDVWIPFEKHSEFLERAILNLLTNNINVFLYNYPLCYLPRKFWSLSKDSISYWKKKFLPECHNCKVKKNCAGFFESTIPFISKLNPIME